jgi:hypothetical protein
MNPHCTRIPFVLVLLVNAIALGSCAILVHAPTPEFAVPALLSTAEASGPWGDAFSVLSRLADQGSSRAAGMALDMVEHGPALYGHRFEASELQLRRWRSQAACRNAPCISAA